MDSTGDFGIKRIRSEDFIAVGARAAPLEALPIYFAVRLGRYLSGSGDPPEPDLAAAYLAALEGLCALAGEDTLLSGLKVFHKVFFLQDCGHGTLIVRLLNQQARIDVVILSWSMSCISVSSLWSTPQGVSLDGLIIACLDPFTMRERIRTGHALTLPAGHLKLAQLLEAYR